MFTAEPIKLREVTAQEYLHASQACGHAANDLVGMLEVGVVPQVGAHDDCDHPERIRQHKRDPVHGEPPALAIFTAASDDDAGRQQDCICCAAKQPMDLDADKVVSARWHRMALLSGAMQQEQVANICRLHGLTWIGIGVRKAKTAPS